MKILKINKDPAVVTLSQSLKDLADAHKAESTSIAWLGKDRVLLDVKPVKIAPLAMSEVDVHTTVRFDFAVSEAAALVRAAFDDQDVVFDDAGVKRIDDVLHRFLASNNMFCDNDGMVYKGTETKANPKEVEDLIMQKFPAASRKEGFEIKPNLKEYPYSQYKSTITIDNS